MAERYLCKVKDVGSTPIGSTKGLEVLLVTCRTVTAKIAGSMPVQTAISRVRLEMVPAWSHKPNHVGSNPALATNGLLTQSGKSSSLIRRKSQVQIL